ncbi:hypothetical protein [Candidatus Photodesmus anomalopis]
MHGISEKFETHFKIIIVSQHFLGKRLRKFMSCYVMN